MFVFRWIFLFVLYKLTHAGYIEMVEVTGCESCWLQLSCRHLTSVIAIFDIKFVPDNGTVNNKSIVPSAFPPTDPRKVLNHRCSGRNHCNFILNEDCPGTENWGPGNITIKYSCVTADRVKKYCNTVIKLPDNFTPGISEGFIHNPGYPVFYPGRRRCRWTILLPPQQKLRLTVLDISLVNVGDVSTPENCNDTLKILDDGHVAYSTCDMQEPPVHITTIGDTVEINLSSQHSLNPLRGFLIHYTAVGCPVPSTPEDGFVIFRNESLAQYTCCIGYVFPDTNSRVKTISCMGALWNSTLPLPDCQKSLEPTPLIVLKKEVINRYPKMVSELVVPIVIMLGLFMINGFVIYYIHKAKKRQNVEIPDEELGPITRNTNTNK